jgi:hypothetical protein
MNEPKAWLYICDGDEKHPVITHTKQDWPNHEGGWWKEVPLYAQREWVGLTDEEIKAFDTWHDNREEEVGWVNPSEIVAYIEAKLKEKNA